jgi:hypothetical protein
MADMKSCFGRELAARFSPGTAPIGTDPAQTRAECYACPDFERCATVLSVILQSKKRD